MMEDSVIKAVLSLCVVVIMEMEHRRTGFETETAQSKTKSLVSC